MKLDSLVTWLDVSRDVLVSREGEFDSQFVVVARGELIVTSNTREIARLGIGECVGGRLLARVPRTTTVVATATSELVTCGRREFTAILHFAPEVARFLMFTADELLQHDMMLQRAQESETMARTVFSPANG